MPYDNYPGPGDPKYDAAMKRVLERNWTWTKEDEEVHLLSQLGEIQDYPPDIRELMVDEKIKLEEGLRILRREQQDLSEQGGKKND